MKPRGRAKTPPRLRTVLLAICLLALSAPVAGLWLMRLYESALIRQTEQELFSQAAVIAAAYRVELRRARGETATATYGPGPSVAPLGLALARRTGLDLARDPVLPPPPEPASVPVRSPPGAAAQAGAALAPLLAETQGVTLAALRVVDGEGVIVATTGGDLGRSLAAWPEIASALSGDLSSVLRRREPPATPATDARLARDEGLRVFVGFPVMQSDRAIGAVLVSRTPRTLAQAIWGKRYAIAGVALTLLAAFGLLALAASRLIARPIRHVADQAQRVARGESETIAPPAHPGTRETADLVEAIARMAATQSERAVYLRGFAASVSHEFKTPLAAMGGAAELLLDHDATMSLAERAHFAATIAAGVARLDLLVRRMLDLARADLAPGGGETEIVAVARRVAERFAQGGLNVSMEDAPPVFASVRPDALDMMLSGLLDNVIAHAGACAHAEIAVGATKGAATLTVSDDGPGVSVENAARIFQAFFTTARDRGGTGLGLAIVASLARAANANVALAPTARGASFRITLERRAPS